MPGRFRLYFWTIRYLKPEQPFWRIANRLGMKCTLKGVCPSVDDSQRSAVFIPELDYDPVFLNRFCAEELMHDRVTFLREAEEFQWDGIWHVDGRSHLWNFNLHYFESIHSLTHCFLESGDRLFLDKTVEMIRGWIKRNPRKRGGDGWSAYTISLRLTNWLAYIAAIGQHLTDDFREELEASMFEQYLYLSGHLEKDKLGNHYFENLKALILCALFFGDMQSIPIYLHAFRKECREQILPDGMHFELSPMYHKIVLEGLLRVCICLRKGNMGDSALEQMARDMLDAAYTLEHGLRRTPLFNDCGDNVSKSMNALLEAAQKHLGLIPRVKPSLPDSGYYFLENGPWRLIVDGGKAGPDYIPGHSHCDAMSFELYREGMPVLVNCGTYAYQNEKRHWFRSTEAHNTVQVTGVEQSEIWSIFRLARRSKTRVLEVSNNSIRMEMTDYKGNRINRRILLLSDALYIKDWAEGLELQSYLHSTDEMEIISSKSVTRSMVDYAPEYGLLQSIHQITAIGTDSIELTVPLA